MDAKMDARQALVAAVDGMNSTAEVACTAGQLRAVGWDLPPDTPDDRFLSVTVGRIAELAGKAEPAAEPLAAREVEELPSPLILCHDPCDPDPE